jgi:hypothetical protein
VRGPVDRPLAGRAFTGNVPDIDVIAYANGNTAHLQVKTWRSGQVHFDGKRFV